MKCCFSVVPLQRILKCELIIDFSSEIISFHRVVSFQPHQIDGFFFDHAKSHTVQANAGPQEDMENRGGQVIHTFFYSYEYPKKGTF